MIVESSTGPVSETEAFFFWLTSTDTERTRGDRRLMDTIVGVPCRKNDDDPKVDSENLKGDVVAMAKENEEHLEKKMSGCQRGA